MSIIKEKIRLVNIPTGTTIINISGYTPMTGITGIMNINFGLSSIVARFFKSLFGCGAHLKKIPSLIMELPQELQTELLVAFLDGDGYILNKKRSQLIGFGICNEQLSNQLCAIFERIGLTPIAHHKKQFSKQTHKYHDTYSVEISPSQAPWLWSRLGGDKSVLRSNLSFSVKESGYTLRRIYSKKETDFAGEVYNIEVENDNSYIVNGIIVHNCDNQIPLACGCETCAQIFWISDESEARAIRPPSCNGVMPDVCAYGELKIYTFPESLLVDPKDPMKALSQKGNFPTLIFKRYDNAVTPYENQFEMVLKRNSNSTSNTGWSFTPGPALSQPQCVWWMGSDNAGNQTKFELWPEKEPLLLGSVLYKGHLITKKSAVIVDYDPNVLTNNQYVLRLWDVNTAQCVGDRFNATNTWRYLNPEKSVSDLQNPKQLVKDATVDLLPIGSLVDIWEFEINRTADARLTKAFFMKQPELNPAALWNLNGAVQFGDLFVARYEVNLPKNDSAEAASEINIPDVRIFERTIWGMNNFEDRMILSDDGGEVEACDGTVQREPSGEPINNDVVAEIDPTIPGLHIIKQQPSLIGLVK